MHGSIAKLFICPKTHQKLELEVFSTFGDTDDIKDGALYTSTTWYPIIDGIPRFVSTIFYQDKYFIKKYLTELRKLGLEKIFSQHNENKSMKKRQVKETAEKFGFEWSKWDSMFDDFYAVENCRRNFWTKTLLDRKELKGKLVLDAGCGNGRYAYFARELADRIICVDIGSGSVESTFRNLKQYENVDVIQADLANLPLPPKSIDVIFSIGVLMHTGDTEGIFKKLATTYIKDDGILAVHIYAKRNVIFNFIDTWGRSLFSKMNTKNNIRFSRWFANLAKYLERVGVLKYAQVFTHLVPNDLVMHDYWSVPVATRHTCAEIEKWCKHIGITILKSDYHKEMNSLKSRLARKIASPYAITIKVTRDRR